MDHMLGKRRIIKEESDGMIKESNLPSKSSYTQILYI